jgi:uncharacterized repeat protein (TIGR03803 family)
MTRFKFLPFIAVLLSFVGFVHPPNACAGNYVILHNFDGSDGASPWGSLVTDGAALYGMTAWGGDFSGLQTKVGNGVIFKVNMDGSNYTVLHSFCDGTVPFDGYLPLGSLTLSGSTLYGMSAYGGDADSGVIFKINIDGSNYTILHSFGDGTVANDGLYPSGTPILSGFSLYGMTYDGGVAANGTIFEINTNGTGYNILHSFRDGSVVNDGIQPEGSLVLSKSTLYGMTPYGGVDYSGPNSGSGVIFKINTNGSNYRLLHSFKNGENPFGSLTLSGSTLYGLTAGGGNTGCGTVFKISTAGSGFKILHSFLDKIDDDGEQPNGTPILSASFLYGVTSGGGPGNGGVAFKMKTNGLGYTILHSFGDGSVKSSDGTVQKDGMQPFGSLILSGSTLYGMTSWGGSNSTPNIEGGDGAIFSLSLP